MSNIYRMSLVSCFCILLMGDGICAAGLPWPLANINIHNTHGQWHGGDVSGNPPYLHFGIDLEASEGTEVRAIVDGYVLLLGRPNPSDPKAVYFNSAIVIGEGNRGWCYGHMKPLASLSPGDTIHAGDIIGTVVDKPSSITGDHLEIVGNSTPPPRPFLPPTASYQPA